MLDSILSDKIITEDYEERMYHSIVKSIITHGSEVRQIKEKTNRK